MYCVYGYTTIAYGSESSRYLERMDEQGDVNPFFSDSIAYVTITDDDHYAISNVENEVFFIAENGLKGADKQLLQFENIAVYINGEPRSKYESKLRKQKEQDDIDSEVDKSS